MLNDQPSYKSFFRLDVESFNLLLNKVLPMLERKDTVMRDSISPSERLSVTLRFPATGNMLLYNLCKVTLINCISELWPSSNLRKFSCLTE